MTRLHIVCTLAHTHRGPQPEAVSVGLFLTASGGETGARAGTCVAPADTDERERVRRAFIAHVRAGRALKHALVNSWPYQTRFLLVEIIVDFKRSCAPVLGGRQGANETFERRRARGSAWCAGACYCYGRCFRAFVPLPLALGDSARADAHTRTLSSARRACRESHRRARLARVSRVAPNASGRRPTLTCASLTRSVTPPPALFSLSRVLLV